MIKKEHIKHLKEMNTQAEKLVTSLKQDYSFNAFLILTPVSDVNNACVLSCRSLIQCSSTLTSRSGTPRRCWNLNNSIKISTRCCMKSNSTAVRYVMLHCCSSGQLAKQTVKRISLLTVTRYWSQLAPDQGMAPSDHPTELRRRCEEEAQQMVQLSSSTRDGQQSVTNTSLTHLISRLTALLLQIKVQRATKLPESPLILCTRLSTIKKGNCLKMV